MKVTENLMFSLSSSNLGSYSSLRQLEIILAPVKIKIDTSGLVFMSQTIYAHSQHYTFFGKNAIFFFFFFFNANSHCYIFFFVSSLLVSDENILQTDKHILLTDEHVLLTDEYIFLMDECILLINEYIL